MSEPGTFGGVIRNSTAMVGALITTFLVAWAVGSAIGGGVGNQAAIAIALFGIWAAGFVMGKDFAETVPQTGRAESNGGDSA